MKVAFLFASFESLGLEALSAKLKLAGHQTALFFDPRLFNDTFVYNPRISPFFDERNKIIKQVADWKPDVVAFSVVSDLYPWASDMAARVKKAMSVPVIMGGIHATSVPDIVVTNPNVDYVVQGEGDEAIVDLIARIEEGGKPDDIPNVWLKKDGGVSHTHPRALIRDLDQLPFADKSLYDGTFIKGSRVYTIMASRGCPFKCTYCNAGLLRSIYTEEKKSFWRARSPDSVIEELKKGEREGRVGVINFYDEVFGADIRWLREFAPKFRREINRPFLACAHPAYSSEEYVALLKEAGCIKVDLGIQSTDPEIRRTILNRHETNEQVAGAIERFVRHGIFLHVENIFNLPGQNENHTIEMARFYNRNRPDYIKVYGLRVYPRTPIEQIALDRGLITQQDVDRNAREEGDMVTSVLLGGSIPNRRLFQFHSLFAMLPLLPPDWVDYILDKKLYQYLPKNSNFIVNIISRLFISQKWEEDPTKRLFVRRYAHDFMRRAKEAIGVSKS